MGCCNGCTVRNAVCHGKNRDGTWRCRDWGIEQEAGEAERQKTLAQREAERIQSDYARESAMRYIRKKKNGHLGE